MVITVTVSGRRGGGFENGVVIEIIPRRGGLVVITISWRSAEDVIEQEAIAITTMIVVKGGRGGRSSGGGAAISTFGSHRVGFALGSEAEVACEHI